MRFFTALAAMLPILVSVTPVAGVPTTEIIQRNTGQFQGFRDSNYGADSVVIYLGDGTPECVNFASYINDAISSYKITNACCSLHVDSNCSGTSRTHCSGAGGVYGFPDLAGTGFNDVYSSVVCELQ